MALDKTTYVAQAERVVKALEKTNRGEFRLTTTKIRNVLALVNELYGMAKMSKQETLSDDMRSHVQYVKMRLVYEAGRDKYVKELIDSSKLLAYMDESKSREQLMLLCHYMEALVAYHKYNGGK